MDSDQESSVVLEQLQDELQLKKLFTVISIVLLILCILYVYTDIVLTVMVGALAASIIMALKCKIRSAVLNRKFEELAQEISDENLEL